jgi:hypothetical protein
MTIVVEPSILDLTFSHIAFPPDLPGQTDDSKTDDVHNSFMARILHAVAKIRRALITTVLSLAYYREHFENVLISESERIGQQEVDTRRIIITKPW